MVRPALVVAERAAEPGLIRQRRRALQFASFLSAALALAVTPGVALSLAAVLQARDGAFVEMRIVAWEKPAGSASSGAFYVLHDEDGRAVHIAASVMPRALIGQAVMHPRVFNMTDVVALFAWLMMWPVVLLSWLAARSRRKVVRRLSGVVFPAR